MNYLRTVAKLALIVGLALMLFVSLTVTLLAFGAKQNRLDVVIFQIEETGNCDYRYNPELMATYLKALRQTWNVSGIAGCIEFDAVSEEMSFYDNLQTAYGLENYSVVFLLSSEHFAPLMENWKEESGYSGEVFAVGGIATPETDIALVNWNYEYSTTSLTHEILHLELEKQGYSKDCYADKVHENADKFVRVSGLYLLKPFDC